MDVSNFPFFLSPFIPSLNMENLKVAFFKCKCGMDAQKRALIKETQKKLDVTFLQESHSDNAVEIE